MLCREAAAPGQEHAVIFYDHGAELVDALAAFVVDGLALDEQSVLVVTAAHRDLLRAELARRGPQMSRLLSARQLVLLDADETLARIVSDQPAAGSRLHGAGDLLASIDAGERPLRIFGEMVAILWRRGDAIAAMELEAVCNQLWSTHGVTLLCAYPVDALGRATLAELDRLCDVHSRLDPPGSYGSGADPGTDAGAGSRASRVFVPLPAAVPAVRRFIASALDDWRQEGVVGDAVLVASELATNALRYASSPFRVTLERGDGSVRISVEDLADRRPTLCRPTHDATGGRGVFIVDDVSREWGFEPLPQGKVVWAELATTG